MLKRLPSKNQRSKGVRVKHVLQICLLIGVCFWLVYQIKHSREKKKEFDENGSKISNEIKAEDLRLGRKDLPREEPVRNERPGDEEREEVEEEEEEETKNDQSEIDTEIEENDDDDDRMEKKDEDFVEENGGGDLDDPIETVDSSDEDRDQDQDLDRDRIGDHEAREEHYRGDDASSEVTREGEEEEEQLEEEAPDGTIDDNTPDGTETDDESPEKNVDDDDDGITMVSRSKKVRHSALSTKKSNEHEGTENNNNNTVQVDAESSNSSFVEKGFEIMDSSQLKSTEESVSDPGQAQNGTNSVDSENIRVEPNSTVSSETDYKDEVSKDNRGSNGTVQTEEREGSSEKLEETVDPNRPDPIDSTDTQIGQEMNEARTDLETLPGLNTSQGNNNDNQDIAAE